MPSQDLEYYEGQLRESRIMLEKEPNNKELGALVESLSETVERMKGENVPTICQDNIGSTCEVYCEGKWYNAVVLKSRTDNLGGKKVIVKLMGTDQGREYDLKDVKFLPRAEKDKFPIGRKVQAIWEEDGLWYNAEIVDAPDSKPVENMFHVVFEGFDDGATYPVQSDQLREPVKYERPKQTHVQADEEKKTYVTPAGYVIPENLKIDPTKDSEKVIEDKKRKIHQIKSQQRRDKYTEEVAHNKSQWQQFQQRMHPRR